MRDRWRAAFVSRVVELVHRTAAGRGGGEWLRVTHRGIFIGEARDWDGMARLGVDIGDRSPGCLRPAYGSGSAGPAWLSFPHDPGHLGLSRLGLLSRMPGST